MPLFRNYTSMRVIGNPWYLRVLNVIFPFTEHAEGLAGLQKHPDFNTLHGADKLSQPAPSSLHGGIGATMGGLLGFFSYYMMNAYFKRRTKKIATMLSDEAAWESLDPADVLKLARDNYYLLQQANTLARFLHYLRTLDTGILAELFTKEPEILRLALNDTNGLRQMIARDDAALRMLAGAGQYHPIVNEVLKEEGLSGNLAPLKRSLWTPSMMEFPFTWDVRLFLGAGAGVLMGGLVGSAVGWAAAGTVLIPIPVVGTAAGLLLGGVLGSFAAHNYPKFATKLNRYMRLDKKQRFILTDDHSDDKRAWYRESQADVPLFARIFLGMAAGATLGTAVGTVVPVIGNLIGGIGGTFYGAFVGAGLATFSPHLFRLGRHIKKAVVGRAPLPSVDAKAHTQHWYSESQFDLPWYLRLFAGAGGGAALGASIGAYKGALAGSILLPGIGTAAGAAAGAMTGAATGAIAGAVASWASPAVFALGRKIKGAVKPFYDKFIPASPVFDEKDGLTQEKPLDVPWYVRFMSGSAGGATLGAALGTVFPGVGNFFGAMVGGLLGAGLGIATPLIKSAIHVILPRPNVAADNKAPKAPDPVKLPWYVKMFAGAAAGNLFGQGTAFLAGAAATGLASLGLITLATVATVTGAAAIVAAGFTIVGAIAALSTPRAAISSPLTFASLPMASTAPTKVPAGLKTEPAYVVRSDVQKGQAAMSGREAVAGWKQGAADDVDARQSSSPFTLFGNGTNIAAKDLLYVPSDAAAPPSSTFQ